MRAIRPEPPDDFYHWVGRVTLAFAQAELQVGMCGWTAVNGQRWTEDWTEVTGAPNMALDLCRQAQLLLSQDLSDRLSNLMSESQRLRRERNKLNHSALIFDPTTTHESHPWLTRDTRGEEAALLSPENGGELVRALNELARSASDLRMEIFAHVRARRSATPATGTTPTDGATDG